MKLIKLRALSLDLERRLGDILGLTNTEVRYSSELLFVVTESQYDISAPNI